MHVTWPGDYETSIKGSMLGDIVDDYNYRCIKNVSLRSQREVILRKK